jgi:hypothetical protein
MPSMSVDWASVDWVNVGLLSAIAFVATLIGDVVFKHRFWGAILAGVLFAAAYVFLVYYPHGLAVPGLKTGARSAPPALALARLADDRAPGPPVAVHLPGLSLGFRLRS